MENSKINNLKQNNINYVVQINQLSSFEANIKRIVFLALAGVAFIFLPIGQHHDYKFTKFIALFILVIYYMVLLMLNIKKKYNLIDRDKINKTLFIYLLLLVVSIFFSSDITRSIYGSPERMEGLIAIIFYMCLFLVARSCTKLDNKFLISVMVTALIVSLYGILQYFKLDFFIPRDELRTGFGSRAWGTMGNPNFFGSYLVLMIPMAYYLYVIENRKIGLLSFSVLFFTMLCTNTRSSWVGAAVSLLCFIGLHFKYFKINKDDLRKYFVILIIALIIMLVFNILSDGSLTKRLITIFTGAGDLISEDIKTSDNAGAGRGFIWKRVMEMIVEKPLFGYGIENLGTPFGEMYKEDILNHWGHELFVDKAHNEYMNIAVTTGIPSMIIYIIFIYLVLKKGVLSLKIAEFNKGESLNLFLISSVVGYLAQAFFNISVVAVAYIFWIFLGLIASTSCFRF